MAERLYGPSNVTHVGIGNTSIAVEDESAQVSAPLPWAPERTVPFIETDDPAVVDALARQGWARHPNAVQHTYDENQAKKHFKEEGDIVSATLSRTMADTLGALAQQARTSETEQKMNAMLDEMNRLKVENAALKAKRPSRRKAV